MAEISIIVRTKNEERWIGHCLRTLYSQDFKDFEIILVDNDSTDHTVQVAKRFPISKLVNISKFKPGLAINEGIRASAGKYIVCLSAHCIPKNQNWLSTLRKNFDENEKYAAVYGRQLPLSFTDPVDKRDLLIVFGQDRRVQIKDYFFHNANSMFRRDIWEKYPFDEEVTNIEDRVWGKTLTEAGYQIVYDPEASVYHYHGLHQGNSPARARGVVSIIEKVDSDIFAELPEFLKPENISVSAIIPILKDSELKDEELKLVQKAVQQAKQCSYIKNIFIVSNNPKIASDLNTDWIDRSKIEKEKESSLDELLQNVLTQLESIDIYPDSILYINYDYLNRPTEIFNELVIDAQYKGCDTIFPGLVDFGHYWVHTPDDGYKETDSSLKSRKDRDPQYKAMYGLGCLTSSWVIRSGKMIGGKIGILSVHDFKTSFRFKEVQ
ncbi:glycosyltransferase family 2 protein [Leptospira sp. 201903071]|uniref:glycosyltransferase family A protein n=1 Tax=Leptospira ainazelensis TaxID=2810034 RepID=UPI0019668FC4|nr:glycosyltransferase family A protein [Leptospira ainazelensis]MBM9501934.1 glycosyltransferase family 2 protein [Leptospira ainazelensis]